MERIRPFFPDESVEVVKALLDAGANPTDQGRGVFNITPWDVMRNNEKLKGTDVYWLLKQEQYD